jgi:hypothetical protein
LKVPKNLPGCHATDDSEELCLLTAAPAPLAAAAWTRIAEHLDIEFRARAFIEACPITESWSNTTPA